MKSDIKVYYEPYSNSYTVWFMEMPYHEAVSSAGNGIVFTLSAQQAQQLNLALDMEKQLCSTQAASSAELTQDEANNEHAAYDERVQMEGDSQP